MTTENCTSMVDISVSKDVLILGAGSSGLETAAKVAAQGYKVSVIGEKTACARQSGCTSDMLDKGDVNIMQDVALESFAGVLGDFRATLAKGDEKMEKTFGAVIVAPQYAYAPLNSKYGLTLNGKVKSLTQFEAMLSDVPAGTTVAFLSGFAQESTPAVMKRILDCALAVQKKESCNAYIYAGNVKVGARGLERLFTQCRHEGVVCFKPAEKPSIQVEGDAISITAKDPVVRTDVELTPDYLIVDEYLAVGPADISLASSLRVDTDLNGFLPSNNVHRFPVKSNRDGIFIVNNSADASNVALKVKELIGDGVKTVPADRAKVDEDRCVICLTCYRSCPHGAIFWENGAAAISPAACQGCGICASECPMDAIQLGEFTDDSMRASIKDALSDVKDTPSIVAFCCKNSALEAGSAAKEFGIEMPAGFKMVRVPCAGKVDVEFIMKAFVEGADGVMVAACHEGNCKAERGNTFAKWRVNEIQKRLDQMGFGKDRLSFTTIASNMAKEFAGKVNAFAESLKG